MAAIAKKFGNILELTLIFNCTTKDGFPLQYTSSNDIPLAHPENLTEETCRQIEASFDGGFNQAFQKLMDIGARHHTFAAVEEMIKTGKEPALPPDVKNAIDETVPELQNAMLEWAYRFQDLIGDSIDPDARFSFNFKPQLV